MEAADKIRLRPQAMKKLLILLCLLPLCFLSGCVTTEEYHESGEPQDGASSADTGCSS